MICILIWIVRIKIEYLIEYLEYTKNYINFIYS